MEFKIVLGVDMSKEWFNYCLMDAQFNVMKKGQISNDPDTILSFIADLLKSTALSITDILLCMEHTGIYIQHLLRAWLIKGGQLSVVHAPKVSESLAGDQGWDEKDDDLDAWRLAEYAFRFRDKLKLWKAKADTLIKLQAFQRQRERLISAINILEVPVNESKAFDSHDLSQSLMANQSSSLQALQDDLKQLEQTIKELIKSDPYLCQLFKLITSVEGIGPVTAREIIIATNGFTTFAPNQSKAFARYTGVIPKRKRSGKSIRKKDQIGKRCHKKMKSLLTMGAHSLINSKSEMGLYYHRKKNQGKHHLCVINAMRNKLIHRIFAVVRNQVMYQKNINMCLD